MPREEAAEKGCEGRAAGEGCDGGGVPHGVA